MFKNIVFVFDYTLSLAAAINKEIIIKIIYQTQHLPFVQGISVGGNRHPWQSPQVALHTLRNIRQPSGFVFK